MDADLADIVHLGGLVEDLAVVRRATHGLGDHGRKGAHPLHVRPRLAIFMLGSPGEAEQRLLMGLLEGAESLVTLLAYILQLTHQAIELGPGGGRLSRLHRRSVRRWVVDAGQGSGGFRVG